MATLMINEQDAERLREYAQQEQRPVEEIVSRMIAAYHPQPDSSVRSYKAKLYKQARAYWHSVNDAERVSLTDEQLDEQFWCIDPEGIPRLNSDKGKVTLPPDGLPAFLERIWQENPNGEVEEPFDYRKFLHEGLPEHLMRQTQESDDQSNTD